MKTEGDDITAIYNNYVDDMYTYALYLGFNENDIIDAIQDVFCTLCENPNKLKNIYNVKFYLLKSLKNRLIDARCYKKTIEFDLLANHEVTISEYGETVEGKLIEKEEEKEIKTKIQNMLRMLSPRQQEIVFLRFIQGYDYEQIAEIMGTNSDNCRKLVYKAFQTLRTKYPVSLFLFLALLCKACGLQRYL